MTSLMILRRVALSDRPMPDTAPTQRNRHELSSGTSRNSTEPWAARDDADADADAEGEEEGGDDRAGLVTGTFTTSRELVVVLVAIGVVVGETLLGCD